LARKFAELITIAPGHHDQRPNVLLVDLDVEAGGLTSRLSQAMRQPFSSFRTAHDVFRERNASAVQAISVTAAVSLASGNPQHRGHLYLMPASQHDDKKLFGVMAEVERDELYGLLQNMIQNLVSQYGISCVVVDCAPSANPYTAAAATLADFPLFIGRNEVLSYEGIRWIPERFREMYPSFQPNAQRVIINMVAVSALYEARAKQHAVFDYIPLSSDVIHETEGLPGTGRLQMLLFEKYIVDIIAKVFIGKNHLIPNPPEVLGKEWMIALDKLTQAERAPRARRLKLLGYLLWPGIVLSLLGIGAVAYSHWIQEIPEGFIRAALVVAAFGIMIIATGWYAEVSRRRLLDTARRLINDGPEGVFRRLKAAASDRQELEFMKRIADTITDQNAIPDQYPA